MSNSDINYGQVGNQFRDWLKNEASLFVQEQDEDAHYAANCAFIAGYEAAKQNIQIPKPDWSEAPEWANWWAMHAYGDAFWFEHKPYLDENRYWQIPNNEGAMRRDCDYLLNPDIELLQQRPKEQSCTPSS
ncbi:MAG: hypothetical protein KGI50_08260 [Patescibacteria group bacterium]|nr:hypothetical protein [Patescibacteria group bacterium]